MQIHKEQISISNESLLSKHKEEFTVLSKKNQNIEQIVETISNYNIAIPSWALGAGGTRFGGFGFGGEPSNLSQKIEDIGVINSLTKSANAVSLHIPWDIPKDVDAIKAKAKSLGIHFDAMNSNTFQDQENQEHSYKFGSLCHTDKKVRDQAVAHNKQVIQL